MDWKVRVRKYLILGAPKERTSPSEIKEQDDVWIRISLIENFPPCSHYCHPGDQSGIECSIGGVFPPELVSHWTDIQWGKWLSQN